jgi:hypothetical protein
MKRIATLQLVLTVLVVVALVAILVGCIQSAAKTDPVVAAAYAHITNLTDRASIVDWKSATVAEHNYTVEQGHPVYNLVTQKSVDLDGHQVYLVVFKVKDDGILGNILVYVAKGSLEVLGVDLRN